MKIPVKLINLDKAGKLDFIFTAYHELYQPVDSLNADIDSYVPYWVYTIDDFINNLFK